MQKTRKKGKRHGNVTKDDVLSYDEMDRFLLAIDDFLTLIAARVMLFAGLRVQEVIDLKLEDIDFKEGYIQVLHGKGDKYRRTPCDIATLSLIRAYGGDRGLLQGDNIFKMDKRTLQRHIKAV